MRARLNSAQGSLPDLDLSRPAFSLQPEGAKSTLSMTQLYVRVPQKKIGEAKKNSRSRIQKRSHSTKFHTHERTIWVKARACACVRARVRALE